MDNTKKVIVVSASIVGLAAIGIIAFKLIRKSRLNKYVQQAYATVQTAVTGEFPLRYGSRGENVKKLQEYLNTKIQPPMLLLDVDGIFGPLTQAALEKVTGKKSMTEEEFKKELKKIVIYKTT